MSINSAQVKGRSDMNSKIIASACILSLAIILGSCGTIDDTNDNADIIAVTTAETTASTTTALTDSTTAASSNVSTVTTLSTTTALTSVTDGSTVIGNVLTEIEVKLDTEQHYAEAESVKKEDTEQVRNTEYNDTKNTTTTTPVVTTVSAVTTITETENTTVSENTTMTEAGTTTAETTAKVEDNQPYLVYKPSTKYAHRSTCRWNKDDAYKCDDFSQLETRICSECKPDVGDHLEYQAPTVGNANKDDMSYVGNFKMTYYPETHYYPGVCGGSGRTLRGYGDYSDGIRGSVASRSLYEMYGYERNGRTTIYLEFSSYPEMDGWYFLDDYCAHRGVIDVFVFSDAACPFGYDGITWADCWIY